MAPLMQFNLANIEITYFRLMIFIILPNAIQSNKTGNLILWLWILCFAHLQIVSINNVGNTVIVVA